MRLGKLIAALERHPANLPVRFRCVGEVEGVTDGGVPSGFMSYRGFYDRLAIGDGGTLDTVAKILANAREALGATFTGYKGGEYVMSEHTSVYAANYGESTGDQLVAVERRGEEVALVVAHAEDW